jgi:hypothetical protein
MAKITTSNNFARTLGKQRDEILNKLFDQEWWCDLVSMWKPAGQPSGQDGLRLAIRNGYMNFYRNGQSVARVEAGPRSGAHLEVHLKYVMPDDWKNLKRGKDPKGQYYVRLSDKNKLTCDAYAGNLGKYSGLDTLKMWIDETADHNGAEKTFVDKLVSCNPNIIDLEMGLPGFLPENSQKKVAPRMDLVAIEQKNGQDTIIFWEAKMMRNGEERANGKLQPPIITQLKNYETWLGLSGHEDCVRQAYKECCKITVAIHARAKQQNPSLAELGDLVMRVAHSQNIPEADKRPRVIISDQEIDETWVANGHSKKLSDYFVQLVQTENDMDYLFKAHFLNLNADRAA